MKGALHAAKGVPHLVLTSLRTDDSYEWLNLFSGAFTSRGSYKHWATASRVLDQFNTTWCGHPLLHAVHSGFNHPNHEHECFCLEKRGQ